MSLVREANAEPIPGYRLISQLGSGGFGEVWKCEAPGGLFKAIKFVYGNLNALDQMEGVRAEQEMNALQRVKAIRHPFVLSMDRVETIEGELVIVMELADMSLHDRLGDCQRTGLPGIPRDELLAYLRDAAEALDLMNNQYDLQHLDIKPRNLFLVSSRVKVADFGLVKDLDGRTSSSPAGGMLMGGVTPLYASPETFQGIISRHSDQYSLGIVYQELLSGSRPFNGKTPRQLAMQHTKDEPDLRSLPPADRAAVAKALSKNPQHRFPNCMAFIRALVSGQMPNGNGSASNGSTNGNGWRPWSLTASMEDLFLSPAEEGHAAAELEETPPPLTREEEDRLSVTVAQPLTGALKPTLVIGIGGFGLQALQAFRCRMVDRFSSLAKLPMIRYLCLDTDLEGLNKALIGPPEQTLAANELQHLPLQGIVNYRRNRQALDQLTEWLPLEKLYSLPRSLATNGTRALGRLAFVENYHRLLSRLKRELQLLADPDNLATAVNQTGLGVRSEIPQVYILASASGGASSGILVDLAYAVRKVMKDLRFPGGEVVSFLLCGAPSDPATPLDERANLYATLTEIQHFHDSAVEFTAQYGLGGHPLRDGGSPFQAVYLMKLGHRSPEGIKESAARMASYIFHDLTTQLGTRLAQSRLVQSMQHETPFRSFGTYAIWYPRGLMLRVAARHACNRLIGAWHTSTEATQTQDAIVQSCDAVFQDPAWRPETIVERIMQSATNSMDGTPGQALTAFLTTLDAQADLNVAREDPAGWCRQALEKAREWVGSGVSAVEATNEWRKSKLHRIFAAAVLKVADEYIELASKPARDMFDLPGQRLAAADAAYSYLIQRCQQSLEHQQTIIREQSRQTEKCWQAVDHAVDACLNSGTFFLFAANRTRKLLRAFVERLTVYCRQRLTEEGCRSVQSFFEAMQGRLQDLQRELSFCQQRLRGLQDSLMAVQAGEEQELPNQMVNPTDPPLSFSQMSSSHMLREAAMVLASRTVYPDGATDLEDAATKFLDKLPQEQWFHLDGFLQEHVLTPLGGLQRTCMRSFDLGKAMGNPLLEGAAEFLGRFLPTTDVCDAELSSAQSLEVDLQAQLKVYAHLAIPSIGSKKPDREQCYLMVPTSEGGKRVGEMAKEALPNMNIVKVTNQTDLLFCRDQADLCLSDLANVLEPCREAYEHANTSPQTTPHARCDILDWVPIDPV